MKLPLNVEVTVCPLSKASKYFGLRSCCCRVRGGCGCCPAPARASCNRPSPCLVFWELLCCAVLCRNSQHSCYVVTSCPLLATRGEDVSNWKLNLITAAHSPTLTPATLHSTGISTQLHIYRDIYISTVQCKHLPGEIIISAVRHQWLIDRQQERLSRRSTEPCIYKYHNHNFPCFCDCVHIHSQYCGHTLRLPSEGRLCRWGQNNHHFINSLHSSLRTEGWRSDWSAVVWTVSGI